MVEKTIDLKDIELVQFLGVKNKNIQEIEQAFPKAKIISRGNKISIKGNENQLKEVEIIINSLIQHFQYFLNYRYSKFRFLHAFLTNL